MGEMIAVLLVAQSKIMSFEQYAKVRHALPYIVDVRQGKGHLIYFGIKHTRDPKDKQIEQIRKLWLQLKPDEVFNEDITPSSRKSLEESITADGERVRLLIGQR